MTDALSEVEAYEYIRRQLRELGWLVRNPSLGTGGQVWTQNQCLSHPTIKKALGKMRPENIIKLTERYLWVIEGKAARKDIDLAVDEAQNDYSKPINDLHGDVEVLLASGVAGDEASGYAVQTFIRLNKKWRQVTINGQEATGLLSPEDVRVLLEGGTADIHEFAPPQWLFLAAAERINKILHKGGINKETRARTIAALLLSVVDQPPNLDTDLLVLIEEINARSKSILTKNGKAEFAPFVHMLPPTNSNNHVKYQAALVKTIQELLNLNIRSAMNSSTDVLGEFYEVFLKYGNGAKEIGIVLTPRHITRFAVQAVGVSPSDVVLDPACGTGGFLVAAFDYIRQTGTKAQLNRFKQHNLFGIEQESYVAVLAIVNMIFRGDGKNNIVEGNCFTTHLVAKSEDGYPSAKYVKAAPNTGAQAVTRVLMNPPFAVPGSQEKEYKFISHALTLMADGGILFSLLPMDNMFGKNDEKVWRETELLPHHTLLAVISLPDELFYPAAMKQVVAVVIRKGFPHPKEQPVFWARVDEDGQLKVKSRRLDAAEMRPPRSAANDIPAVLPHLQNFIHNPPGTSVNEPMLCKMAPIDFGDPLLELLPEVYLDGPTPTPNEIEAALDQMARDTAAFLIRFRREKFAEAFDEKH